MNSLSYAGVRITVLEIFALLKLFLEGIQSYENVWLKSGRKFEIESDLINVRHRIQLLFFFFAHASSFVSS